MKLLLGSFTATMGDIPEKHDVFSALLPPLEKSQRGWDIDYSLLLWAESLVFDAYSYDRLSYYRQESVKTLRDNLRILNEAGFLQLEDYQAKLRDSRPLLKKQLDATTSDYSLWLPHLRAQILKYDKILDGFTEAFGDVISPWDRHTFGIASYLLATKRKVEPEEALKLRKLIYAARRRNSEQIREVLRPVVQVAQANIHLSSLLGCVPYCWGTLTGYYDQTLVMLARTLDPERKEMRQCRRFFGQAFPLFKPRAANEWIRLLSNPKIVALRNRIAKAIEDGEAIDADFGRRSLESLAKAEARASKIKRYSGWIALPAAVMGGIAGHSLAGTPGAVVGHTVPIAGHKILDSAFRRAILRPHDWLYFTAGFTRPHPSEDSTG